MNGELQLELYLHEYKMAALSSVLEERGSSVEEQMQKTLTRMYEFFVPSEVQEEIRARMDAEYTTWETGTAEEQKSRLGEQAHTVFRVRESGLEKFFGKDGGENLLTIANLLCCWKSREPAFSAVQRLICGLKPICAEQYERLLARCMANPGSGDGVFELDFDRQELSAAGFTHGWRTYSLDDIFTARSQTYSNQGLKSGRSLERFLASLDGRQYPTAGHLSDSEISFAEEISEIDGLLNFYMETCFDADAVFGTHVCTAENDDTLNVYANYDMASGQVCDELEVDLHWADGREEAVAYRLNPVEKAVLLRKMDAYCQEQTGQTLKEYSAQRLAEDMAPPGQPVL